MCAGQVQQAFGTGLGGGQAGDDIGGLRADFSAYLADAFDARNLGGARRFEMGDDLGANRDFAYFQAAMPFSQLFLPSSNQAAERRGRRGERSPKLSAILAFSSG